MSGVLEMLRSRLSPRAAVLALVTISVAACSADMSRFNDNPFASLSNPGPTAGMPQAQTAQAPQPHSGASTSVAANSGAASEATGSVLRKTTSSGNWSWDGGTATTAARGESTNPPPRRSGSPAPATTKPKTTPAPAPLHPGQRWVIPRYKPPRAAPPPPPRPAVPTPAPAASPAGNANVHVVAAGDTPSKIAHRYHKSGNEIAKANNVQPTATPNIGDRPAIPRAQAPPAQATHAPAPPARK